jgi:hypothetical protein
MTKDEVPFTVLNYETSDGIRIDCWTEFYASPEPAGIALQNRIENSNITTREPILDEKWKQIGEKLIIEYPPSYPHQGRKTLLLRIVGSELTIIQSFSIKDVLEFEKDNRR